KRSPMLTSPSSSPSVVSVSVNVGQPSPRARRRCGCAGAADDLLGVETLDVRHDLLEGVLDGEVAAVEHVQLGVGQVAQVGAAPLGREEDVVLAPEDERLRLPPPEERLPLRIQVDVGAVIVEEVDLDLARIRALEEMQIHVPVVGADALRIAVFVCVYEIDPGELE